MQRKNAIRHLRNTAELCERWSGPLLDDEQSPLVAAYAYGPILDPAENPDYVSVAVVLDAPAEELTWCARPPWTRWVSSVLEFARNPVIGSWRPAAWPVWNHVIERPLRVWSADGVDVDALEALARGEAEDLRLPPPSRDELAEQLRLELAACRDHLRTVRDSYWEYGWRRENKGYGEYPEHHLWNAVDGYVELQDAVRALDD